MNAWLSATDATIAVGTDGMRSDGTRVAASSLLLITHLNAVIAFRGHAPFLNLTNLRILGAGLDSFDEMLDFMPAFLRDVEQNMPKGLISENGNEGNHLIAVGWSDRSSRMLGRSFCRRNDEAAFAETDFDSVIAPWDESMPEMPKTIDELDNIARAQVHWLRNACNAVAGGRLIECRLTKSELTVRHRLTFSAG